MSRNQVERDLIHCQLELHRYDADSIEEAHKYLVRALISLEALRHPRSAPDPILEAIHRATMGET